MCNNISHTELEEPVYDLNFSRNTFSAEDDALLLNLVEDSKGKPHWRTISSKMNGKSPRQCRERYKNYLNPSLLHEDWTPEEDELLIVKHKELGNHWIAIAKCIPGRTGNSVRNRWNLLSRKHKNCHKRVIKPKIIATKEPKPKKVVPKNQDHAIFHESDLGNDDSITDIFSKLLDVTANYKLFEMPMDPLSYFDIF